jgi:hypothetical protein
MRDLAEIETLEQLGEWIRTIMPNALVVDTEGELVIQTGLTYEMGGLLVPLDQEELEEARN